MYCCERKLYSWVRQVVCCCVLGFKCSDGGLSGLFILALEVLLMVISVVAMWQCLYLVCDVECLSVCVLSVCVCRQFGYLLLEFSCTQKKVTTEITYSLTLAGFFF